jgi:hypothetical protein
MSFQIGPSSILIFGGFDKANRTNATFVFNTANNLITTWNTYSLPLVILPYFNNIFTNNLAFSGTTVTISPLISGLAGSIVSNIFTPSPIVTMNASQTGTTLTLSAANANIVVGMVVLPATGQTAFTYIVSGSGTSWTINVSSGTLNSRSYNFYSPYMKSTGTINPTIPNSSIGDWIIGSTLTYGNTKINAINNSSGVAPTFTLSITQFNNTGTYSFYSNKFSIVEILYKILYF